MGRDGYMHGDIVLFGMAIFMLIGAAFLYSSRESTQAKANAEVIESLNGTVTDLQKKLDASNEMQAKLVTQIEMLASNGDRTLSLVKNAEDLAHRANVTASMSRKVEFSPIQVNVREAVREEVKKQKADATPPPLPKTKKDKWVMKKNKAADL